MRTPFAIIISTALLAVFIGFSITARAEGGFNAVAYGDLPGKFSVQVEPFDDSNDNLVAKTQLEQALRSNGINIDDSARYILNFEIRNRLGSLSAGDNRHILKFQTSGGRGGGENTEARINVFDSQAGGLLNKGPAPKRISNRTIYRLEVNIEGRDDGKRLWDAWAEAELEGGDGGDLVKRMIPVITKRIGTTQKRVPFELY